MEDVSNKIDTHSFGGQAGISTEYLIVGLLGRILSCQISISPFLARNLTDRNMQVKFTGELFECLRI